jgi:uncharacterized glyoxalase superfamily protein PhnB
MTISPCLFYRDAPAALDWLNRAFGFETILNVPGENGDVAHAEMRLGDGIIMLGTARDAMGWKSPRDLPGINQTISIYIEDVQAHHDRAVAAGARIIFPLEDKDYGGSGYTVEDLEGHVWSFGSYRPGA